VAICARAFVVWRFPFAAAAAFGCSFSFCRGLWIFLCHIYIRLGGGNWVFWAWMGGKKLMWDGYPDGRPSI